jgi:hypothetical protein
VIGTTEANIKLSEKSEIISLSLDLCSKENVLFLAELIQSKPHDIFYLLFIGMDPPLLVLSDLELNVRISVGKLVYNVEGFNNTFV